MILTDQQALSPNTNKKNVRRGKTLTNVSDQTPEEIVARRISQIAQDKSPPPSNDNNTVRTSRTTHIRSYSEPKDTIEDITTQPLDGGNNANGDEKEKKHNQTDSLAHGSRGSVV